jgi:hypothetical protein
MDAKTEAVTNDWFLRRKSLTRKDKEEIRFEPHVHQRSSILGKDRQKNGTNEQRSGDMTNETDQLSSIASLSEELIDT